MNNTKTNPKLKAALLDLFETILDCNDSTRAMFWLDYSGHVSSFSVRKAEGDYNTRYENLGCFSTSIDGDDDSLENTLADIANKKALVLATTAEWTNEKMAERADANRRYRLEMLKQEIDKLEAK